MNEESVIAHFQNSLCARKILNLVSRKMLQLERGLEGGGLDKVELSLGYAKIMADSVALVKSPGFIADTICGGENREDNIMVQLWRTLTLIEAGGRKAELVADAVTTLADAAQRRGLAVREAIRGGGGLGGRGAGKVLEFRRQVEKFEKDLAKRERKKKDSRKKQGGSST